MKTDLEEKLALEKGVTAQFIGNFLKVKGPQGEVSRNFVSPGVSLEVGSEEIVLSAKKATKREKRMLSTFAAHIRNMLKGVVEPYVYTLKVCSGHFPITVSISGREFVIKNFLGETVPRKMNLPLHAEVKISGTEITVKSPDKEIAGGTAAAIEQLCRITKRDIRIFQDGCYIIKKAGKTLS